MIKVLEREEKIARLSPDEWYEYFWAERRARRRIREQQFAAARERQRQEAARPRGLLGWLGLR